LPRYFPCFTRSRPAAAKRVCIGPPSVDAGLYSGYAERAFHRMKEAGMARNRAVKKAGKKKPARKTRRTTPARKAVGRKAPARRSAAKRKTKRKVTQKDG